VSSLVVEFCGLPGSGKTTVAKHTQEALLAQGVACVIADAGISARAPRRMRVARRTWAAVRQTTRHPLGTVDSTRLIASVGQPSRRDTVAGVAQWLAVRDLVSRAHRVPGVHLLEEGIIQRTWTIALRARSDPSQGIWRGLPSRSRSDLVLYVDAPVALAESRLGQRASRHSRTQQLPAELRRAELERGRELLEHLLSKAPLPVLRIGVDDQASPAELGERAAEKVLQSVRDQAAT